MRTFLISYDLAKPSRNRHVLAQLIMTMGTRWARPLEQTWYVTAETSVEEMEAKLAGALDSDDGMLIQAVDDKAVLTNTALRWFRQRQAPIEIAQDSNIIPFPAPSTPPSDEPELPFAEAC